MNQDQPSRRLVEWWQTTGESAPDVTALETAIADTQRQYGSEWKSAVLDAFMAPPETPGESEAPEEKTGGGTIWQVLQAIAALAIALMAMVFVITSILRNSGDRSVEPTPATVAQDVAPTIQALSGRLDVLAARVETLGQQLEKALSTPTPAPTPTPTPTPTPSPPPPTPIPSPPPVISLKGRVEPVDLAQKIALLVKIGQDGATDGEAVTPTATGAFTLTLPADWEGNPQVEWTLQEVVVKNVTPEDTWKPTKDPWTDFVMRIQSRNPISQGAPLPDLVIALEPVPQTERFVGELSGTFSEEQGAQRRTFPGQEGTPRSGKIPPIKILGQARVGEKEWGLACCESTPKSFFWASLTDQIIFLDDKTQASKLPLILLPNEVGSLNSPPNGWQFKEVEGIVVLFNQSGNVQELVWSLDAPSGWFRLQAWAAVDSTATANYEVLVGPDQVSLPPVTGTTVVSPPAAGTMSSFADIGVYYLAQPQPVTVRLKAPAEGKIGVGLIRVLRLTE